VGGRAAQQGDGVEVLPPPWDDDPPLVITRIEAMPDHVDVVALYRPAAEHARIAQRAVELGARTVWVQLGALADDARRIAAGAHIAVIEDTSIDDAIRSVVSLHSAVTPRAPGPGRYRVLRR
ncbi:MAG: CoA-binding protein, partial [Candidatus Dormibacteria bacterium]